MTFLAAYMFFICLIYCVDVFIVVKPSLRSEGLNYSSMSQGNFLCLLFYIHGFITVRTPEIETTFQNSLFGFRLKHIEVSYEMVPFLKEVSLSFLKCGFYFADSICTGVQIKSNWCYCYKVWIFWWLSMKDNYVDLSLIPHLISLSICIFRRITCIIWIPIRGHLHRTQGNSLDNG